MPVVIAVTDSSGKTRRCNGTCHNAKGDECHCVCHGKNHGKGLEQAIENTKEMASVLAAEYGSGLQLK